MVQDHSGAGHNSMSRQKTTIFANMGRGCRCGRQAFFDMCLSICNRMAASSYVPPVDIKTAALNQNRRWKERLDMRNWPAQQRFFSFLPLGRLGFYWLLFRKSQINRNEDKHDSECDKDDRPPLLLSAGNPDYNKQYPQQHWRNHRKKPHFIYSFQDVLLYHDDWLFPNHELQ